MESLEGGGRDATLQGIGRGNYNWLRQENGAELRRPYGASGSGHLRNVDQHKTDQTLNKEKKSTLSVYAPEFVPKSNHSGVQDRLIKARYETPLNLQTSQAITKDHVQDTSQQRCNVQDIQIKNSNNYNTNDGDYKEHPSYTDNKIKELGTSKDETSDFSVMQYLINISNTLTSNPAEFIDIVPPFVSTVRSDPGNLRSLQQIITTIVEWSISETNFRYSGARLCTYLDASADLDEKTLFRDILYYTCKIETQIQELDWQRCKGCTDHLQKRCHGLILFLAELVAQMDETFAFTLGAILMQLIINILKKPASNSVKYICQALKLAGQTIEKDKSRNKEMENMMRALTDLVTQDKVDTHIGHMVHSVRELRNGDWGRNTSNCDSSRMHIASLKEVQVQQLSDEPVMYGPDGDILSAEESKFLQDHIETASDLNEQGILEEAFIDDEYDDEIAAAYEEFLRDKTKQNIKQDVHK